MSHDSAGIASAPLAPRFGPAWRIALAISGVLVLLLAWTLITSAVRGIGIWGENIPFVWGLDLVNYSWWIGIANGANLVAALLVIRGHDLRTAVNRFAEGVALAAVICAGLFPIFHLGKPWLFHWVFPFPHPFGVWPQFRSPLTWDFWAISAYAIITLVFWSIGLIPDLASLRDRARNTWPRRIYGLFALGWRGSARHWTHHQAAYRTTAVLILPLILIMQTTVALEHAVMVVPGWHEAWQPVHFVVTGLSSGLAAVLMASALLQRFMGVQGSKVGNPADRFGLLLAASALVTLYVQAGWFVTALMADDPTREAAIVRVTGTYGGFFWGSIALGIVVPQLLWLKPVRRSMSMVVLVAVLLNVGIWLDRFSLLIGGLERRWLPDRAAPYWPTMSESLLLVGSLGLFAAMVLLSVRFLPVIALYETRRTEQEDSSR